MLHNVTDSRVKAALLHLAGSALIAATVVLSIITIWYPGPTISATGAAKIFLMVIAIDVCLGPLLTLIVFNKQKKELPRDLTIILIVQIAALAYGIYTVTIARPAYYVFAVDRFELVQANELTKKSQEKAFLHRFNSTPIYKAEWITALLPENPEEKNELLFAAVDGGSDLAQSPKYYRDYSMSKEEIIKRAQPISELYKYNPDTSKKAIQALESRYKSQNNYGYLPMSARKFDLSVIIDLETGDPVEIANFRPW